MPSNNQRNNELEFTPTLGTQQAIPDYVKISKQGDVMPRNMVFCLISYRIQGLIPLWRYIQNQHTSLVRKTDLQSQIIKEYPTGVCEPVCMITSHITSDRLPRVRLRKKCITSQLQNQIWGQDMAGRFVSHTESGPYLTDY